LEKIYDDFVTVDVFVTNNKDAKLYEVGNKKSSLWRANPEAVYIIRV
jgi:hypothetical protein